MTKRAAPVIADRGSLSGRFASAAGHALITNVLAIAGITALFAGASVWIGVALLIVSFVFSLSVHLRDISQVNRQVLPTGEFTVSRVVIAIAIGAFYRSDADSVVTWIAAGLMAALIATEVSCARVASGAIPHSVRLPGISVRNRGYFGAAWIFYVNSLTLMMFAAVALSGMAPWIAIIIICVAAIPSAVVLLDGIYRIRARRIAERQVPQSLRTLTPTFAVHWDAHYGTEYQLSMWLPYLERLGKEFFVIVRNEETFDSVSALTSAPVLLRKTMADLDATIVPSLKTAFYTNNVVLNSHFVRYSELTHIQLNHGDSDKAPSYNPVFRMFDKNFVSGQAAIDRFANHGVTVPAKTFSIVGRPQVEGIRVGASALASEHPIVLYAPTWAGHNLDSDYSSLPIGHGIVEGLLRRGCTVIYRSHPYTAHKKAHAVESERIKSLLENDANKTGRQHIWGEKAEQGMTMVDCFNAADALISDVSSVVPDFLYSEKPFAMATMTTDGHSFIEDFPIARAAYLFSRDLEDFQVRLDELLGPDPLHADRRALKTYYLGDFDPNNPAKAFLAEAAQYV